MRITNISNLSPSIHPGKLGNYGLHVARLCIWCFEPCHIWYDSGIRRTLPTTQPSFENQKFLQPWWKYSLKLLMEAWWKLVWYGRLRDGDLLGGLTEVGRRTCYIITHKGNAKCKFWTQPYTATAKSLMLTPFSCWWMWRQLRRNLCIFYGIFGVLAFF